MTSKKHLIATQVRGTGEEFEVCGSTGPDRREDNLKFAKRNGRGEGRTESHK